MSDEKIETSPEELAALLGPGDSDDREAPTPPPGPVPGPGARPPGDPGPGGAALVEAATRYPVTVMVGVLLVALFGIQALFFVPIQLTPDVSRPVITVETIWPGANPQEVEREIVDEQEEYLKSLEGLVRMKSESAPSLGRVTLEFVPGTDIQGTLVRVNNKLNQVPSYPDEAERPVIQTAGARDDAIAWFVLIPAEDAPADLDIEHMLDFVEDEVEARLERVPGVSAANIFGGREREVRVTIDPARLAARGVTIPEVADALRRENADVSAGYLDEGKRRYNIRTLGAFEGVEGIADIVVREDLRDRVFLRDVATVAVDYKDPGVVVRHKGISAIALNAQRQIGSNVLAVMDGLKAVRDELNEGILARRKLRLELAYDSSDYIRGALDLVFQNILVGGVLAILVLLVFLRSARPTAIIAIAIPVSAVGTFFAMFALGRNVNVVSLAGLSFAVGMLVDNSIVVLENIFSHVERGKDRVRAAVDGTVEVWGAIFASTATTVAVFLPIFFIQAEIAQLFRDIAIAICCAVSLSLVVSVTVIPMLAARWMKPAEAEEPSDLVDAGRRFNDAATGFVHRICGTNGSRLVTVAALTLFSLGGTWLIAPAAEYLPAGNQNLVFGILIPPSGYNLDEFHRIGDEIEGNVSHLWKGDDPLIRNFFYVAFGRQVFMGAQAVTDDRIDELKGPLQAGLSTVPGMFAIVVQAGIFNNGLEGGRSVELEFKGPDLQRLVGIAGRAFGGVMQHIPGAQSRPVPGLELGQPELQVLPDRRRLAEAGMRPLDLGFAVDVLADGAQVSEVRMPDGKEVDLTLRGPRAGLAHTQDLAAVPLHLPSGDLAPLGSLGDIQISMGPDQVNHSERERTVSLIITPPQDMALQDAMTALEEKILAPMEADGTLARPYSWRLAGTADKLTSTRRALQGEFLTAVAVTYLLMASLFESFLFPLVILFSVPLASFGGFALLRSVMLVFPSQQLDVLSMLGFVILVGIVVNNAILLVDRTLRNVREEGMEPRDAVVESVANRIRPIFMSTLTSVFGMAPLILMTGPGSELYRGIGSVVVGGLLFSTIFTLVLIPALLSLVLEVRRSLWPDARV